MTVPPGALDRAIQLERVGRWLARREQTVAGADRTRAASAAAARSTRAIAELERELHDPDRADARRRCSSCPAAARSPPPSCSAEIGPIDRFRTDAQLARHGGVAPLEASSGRTHRHRLDRGGNRQLNCAPAPDRRSPKRAMHPPARAYLERKQTEGKSRREAIRCLKRQLARVVFNTLKASPALT